MGCGRPITSLDCFDINIHRLQPGVPSTFIFICSWVNLIVYINHHVESYTYYKLKYIHIAQQLIDTYWPDSFSFSSLGRFFCHCTL